MGRSVDYLSYALHKTYIDRSNVFDDDESVDYFIARENWQFFQDDLTEKLMEVAPSLDKVTKRFDGRETEIILDNKFCEIGISEYCGLVSVSIRVNEMDYRFNRGLATNWINKTWPSMKKALDDAYPTLTKVGTFSNGEGVYEKTVKA